MFRVIAHLIANQKLRAHPLLYVCVCCEKSTQLNPPRQFCKYCKESGDAAKAHFLEEVARYKVSRIALLADLWSDRAFRLSLACVMRGQVDG